MMMVMLMSADLLVKASTPSFASLLNKPKGEVEKLRAKQQKVRRDTDAMVSEFGATYPAAYHRNLLYRIPPDWPKPLVIPRQVTVGVIKIGTET